jgi:hypothetical protein
MFTNAKLETSCKNEHEPAKIAVYSVYYTKYPEQKWRRSITAIDAKTRASTISLTSE